MIDKSKVSEQPISEGQVLRVSAGGWGLFAKDKMHGWMAYFRDGEEGIIKDESVAREMYALAIASPDCLAARLIRIKCDIAFDR